MRTAIFLGLMLVAKSICPSVTSSISETLAIILIIMMLMDVVDFIKKTFKK